ncbi:hypothetical protein U1Q18_037382, partial [Sarracenia purpurea var. burkii]
NGNPKVDECHSGDSSSRSSKNHRRIYHQTRNRVAEVLEDINVIFYDEERIEIYSDNRHDLVHVWSN